MTKAAQKKYFNKYIEKKEMIRRHYNFIKKYPLNIEIFAKLTRKELKKNEY